MRLQQVTVYRIYTTTNNTDLIENIITMLKEKYNIDNIIVKRSNNVRGFVYIEIEASKVGSKEEIKKFFESIGMEQIKIDVVELKKPM